MINWPTAITAVFCLGVLVYLHWHHWYGAGARARDTRELNAAPETRIPKFDARINPMCAACNLPMSLHEFDNLGNAIDGKCEGYFD